MSDFIQDAVVAANVRLTSSEKQGDVYRCELVSDHGKLVKHISGAADGTEPTLRQIIFQCALEAQHIDDCDDITDWAKDLGKDLAAPAVLAQFQQAMDERRDFEFLLSYRVFEDLQMGLAISQAIGNARPR